MKKTFFTLGASAVLLSGCMGGPSSTNGIVQGQTQKGGFLGLQTKDNVEVTSADAFKGVDDVVIGGFTVGFGTYKTDSRKAGGGLTGSGFGGKSTAKSELKGIDDATLQAITETAYSKFVADLKAKGYNVVDRSKLADYEAFASTNTYDAPYEDSNGGIFGKSSVTKYFVPAAFNGKMRSFMGDIPGFTGGFGFSNPYLGASKFAKETGTHVLSVVMVLDFANSDGYGGWGSTSSGVTVGQGMTLMPNYTKLNLIGGDSGTFSSANGALTLGQPITSDKAFADVAETTTAANKVTQRVVGVIGVLGGIGSNASGTYEFKARPADYKAAALDVIGQGTKELLTKASSLK